MEDKIASFEVNHLDLKSGVYISRLDRTPSKDTVVTVDMRMVSRESLKNSKGISIVPKWFREDPRFEDNTLRWFVSGLHTIEHVLATELRKCSKFQTLYCGPGMCCTMFYLVLVESTSFNLISNDQLSVGFIQVLTNILTECQHRIIKKNVPGISDIECGNPELHSFEAADLILSHFLSEPWELKYPALK